jgi:hypothetical protein
LFLGVFIFCQIFAIFIPRYGQIKEGKADILFNKPFWSEAPALWYYGPGHYTVIFLSV